MIDALDPQTKRPAPTEPANDRHYTYQQQYRKCGKATCGTCNNGEGHGPYWYAYYREESKVKSIYLGNHNPNGVGVAKTLAILEKEREQKRLAREAKQATAALKKRRTRRKKSTSTSAS